MNDNVIKIVEKLALPIALAVAGYYVVKNLSDKLIKPTIKDSDWLVTLDTATSDQQHKFDLISDVNYHVGKKTTLSKDRATQLASEINDSFSWFNDDEDLLYGALTQAKSIADMSLIASTYYELFGEYMQPKIAEVLGGFAYYSLGKQYNDFVYKLPYEV